MACEEFEERFGLAVRSHLVSDVPVGAFLSGGVDSSAVVSFMEPRRAAGMYTFSTTFRGLDTFDEGPFARRVADHFGTNHREIDLGADAARCAARPRLALRRALCGLLRDWRSIFSRSAPVRT